MLVVGVEDKAHIPCPQFHQCIVELGLIPVSLHRE